MRCTILLWGLSGDSPFDAVHRALLRRRAGVVTVDQRNVADQAAELEVGPGGVSAVLTLAGQSVDLDEVSAAYVRPYDVRRIPVVRQARPDSALWRHALALDDTMLAWAEVAPAMVVNRPSAMTSNASKPYWAALIRAAGFAVPETLLTTDVEAAQKFWDRHREVVFKSISSTRSVVTRLDRSHRRRFADLAWCPTQFQAWVPGVEHHVHVVGDDVFACEITSAAADNRYPRTDAEAVRMRSCRLPAPVAERCRRLTTHLGLAFAGLDLRRAADGTWYCFEVNPYTHLTTFLNDTRARPRQRDDQAGRLPTLPA